jgi:hypothetical protein
MAENLMAKAAETVLGHGDKDRATHVDSSNPDREGGKYADESEEKMKALVWMGRNDVRVGLLASAPALLRRKLSDAPSQSRLVNLRFLTTMTRF